MMCGDNPESIFLMTGGLPESNFLMTGGLLERLYESNTQTGGSRMAEMTPQEAASSYINANLWNYYTKSYKPVIKKYIDRESSPYVWKQVEKQEQGKVKADVMGSMDVTKGSSNVVKNADTASKVAKVLAQSEVDVAGKVRSKQVKGIQNIIDIGRGKETTANAGLQNLADQSVRWQQFNEAIKGASDASNENAVGSIAGAVAGGVFETASYYKNKDLNPTTGVGA